MDSLVYNVCFACNNVLLLFVLSKMSPVLTVILIKSEENRANIIFCNCIGGLAKHITS